MIRIGRQVPHFDQVDINSIRARFSDDRRFRHLLQMKYLDSLYDTGRSRKAAVILKNPSVADQGASDTTIRKGAHRVFEVRGKQQTLQPLHGMMWGYGDQLVPYLKLKVEE